MTTDTLIDEGQIRRICDKVVEAAAEAMFEAGAPVPMGVTGPSPVITASRRGSSSYGRGPRGRVSTSETLLPPKA